MPFLGLKFYYSNSSPPISLFPSCSQLYACADYSGVVLVHSFSSVSCFLSGFGCWISRSMSTVSEPRKVSDLQGMWELVQWGQCQTGQKICSLHSSVCLVWVCRLTMSFLMASLSSDLTNQKLSNGTPK